MTVDPGDEELSDLEALVLALIDGEGLVLEGTADRDPLDDEVGKAKR